MSARLRPHPGLTDLSVLRWTSEPTPAPSVLTLCRTGRTGGQRGSQTCRNRATATRNLPIGYLATAGSGRASRLQSRRVVVVFWSTLSLGSLRCGLRCRPGDLLLLRSICAELPRDIPPVPHGLAWSWETWRVLLVHQHLTWSCGHSGMLLCSAKEHMVRVGFSVTPFFHRSWEIDVRCDGSCIFW